MLFLKSGKVRIEQLRDEITRAVVEFPTMAIQWNQIDGIEIEDVGGKATQYKVQLQAVIDDHVPSMRYFIGEIKELESIIAAQQKAELLSLPNWATWTYLEAETEVSKLITGGITQTTAEAAIDGIRTNNVSLAITDLKPILKNMVRAIYAVDTILKAMAKCIVFMRDILKP